MFLTEGGDEITHRVGNFVTPKKKMGLSDGIGQKKPCHHLGPFFYNLLPEKILGYLKEFEKKIDKCKRGDKITRFDSIRWAELSLYSVCGELSWA